jgi:hypothetical protein
MTGRICRFKKRLFYLVITFVIFGCATAPKEPLTGLVPGKEMTTIQSSVSISVKNSGKSFGARGYLIFQRPDLFHLAVLSPLGQPMFDFYSGGNRLTCVVPGRHTAYSDLFSELPNRDGLKAWTMMSWIMETSPAGLPNKEVARINSSGLRETLEYDELGLLKRKETEEGNVVLFNDYRSVDGVAFPESIEVRNTVGDWARVVFDDPEINRKADPRDLVPQLDGTTSFPFSEFKGF